MSLATYLTTATVTLTTRGKTARKNQNKISNKFLIFIKIEILKFASILPCVFNSLNKLFKQ